MTRFTAEFGMGSGGSTSLLSPGKLVEYRRIYCLKRQTSRDSNRAADKLKVVLATVLLVVACFLRTPQFRCLLSQSNLTTRLYGQAARAISTSQLNASQRFHTLPINVVVFDGPLGGLKPQGDLILKEASRLDAFSGYPVRT